MTLLCEGGTAGAVSTDARPTITALADAVIELGGLALRFGEIQRTAVYHTDRVTREDDAEHTVMLGWVACALAARCFPALDLGAVAQYALVHDAAEVYAGDTPTLRIDAAGRADKAAREHAALLRLEDEFGHRLPWVPRVLACYEAQDTPEARFVRGVDKILPKIVHLLDGATGLREQGVDRVELADICTRQRADMAGYVGEFAEVLALHANLTERVINVPELCADSPSTVDGEPTTVPCGFGCGHLAESEPDLDAHEAGCCDERECHTGDRIDVPAPRPVRSVARRGNGGVSR